MKFEWPHNKIWPQKLLQIFQVTGREGRFGFVKLGHCSKYSPIYIFSGDTFKIVIDSAKNEIQTFLYSVIFNFNFSLMDHLLYKFAMLDPNAPECRSPLTFNPIRDGGVCKEKHL